MNMSEKLVLSKRKEEPSSTIVEDAAGTRRPRKILTPDDLFRVPDKPPKRKATEPGNKCQSPEIKNRLESLKKPLERHNEKTEMQLKKQEKMKNVITVQTNPISNTCQSPEIKNGLGSLKKPLERRYEKTEMQLKKLEKIKNVIIEQTNPISKANGNVVLDASKSLFTQMSENSMIERRIGMYESHALNMLADLALNSFSSSSPYVQSEYIAHSNEPLVKEKASTGESESTLPHPQKDSSLSELSNAASKEPEQNLQDKKEKTKDGRDVSQRRTENSEKPITHKAYVAAAKAKARNNATSKISLEHSYSQLPLEDMPDGTSKETAELPAPSDSEETVSSSTPDMVVEKSSNLFLPGQILLVTSEKLLLAVSKEPRTVSKVDDKYVITFCPEAKYNFDLDSKFTSDPLEKTVNRALHGPWNHHLKEKVEDVKIILHMWLALFYSKANKQPTCSSRKVVEHSNPAKYVSINTVLDPFEFYEIVESDAIQLCTADSNKSVTPTGRKSGAPSQGKFHKLEKSQNENQPEDLSMSTKDFNVELASEIFQTCKSSERTFYTNSILTTVKCQMAEMSQSAPQPTNYMRTIFDASVPAACYISDTKLLNLNDKSENGVDIGGGSSKKVHYKGNEHEYYKAFCKETQRSSGSEHVSKKLNKDADENKENATICSPPLSGNVNHAQAESLPSHKVKVSPATETQEATEKAKLWITRDYYCPESTNVLPSALNVDISTENPSSVITSTKNGENPTFPDGAAVDESTLNGSAELPKKTAIVIAVIAENKDSPSASIIPADDANNEVVEKDEPVQCAQTLQNEQAKGLGITDQTIIQNPSPCDLSGGSSDRVKDVTTPCKTTLENGKVLESNRRLKSIDYISTVLSTVKSLTPIPAITKESAKPRKSEEGEHQTSSNTPSTVKKTALELSGSGESTESSSSTEDVEAHSAPNTISEDVLEITSETLSDNTNDCVIIKELARNEIIDVLTSGPGYSQTKEHSYVSKMSAERRKQLEQSILAARALYVKSISTASSENIAVKTTSDSKSSEQQCLDEANKGLSQRSQDEQANLKGQGTVVLSIEEPVVALDRDNASIAEKGQTCETQNGRIGVQEKDLSHSIGVGRAVREMQVSPLQTQCDLPDVLIDTQADPGSKESEAMTSDVIEGRRLHSDNVQRTTEVTVSALTDSCKVDDFEKNSIFEDLNSQGDSDTGAVDDLDIQSKELFKSDSGLYQSPEENIENMSLRETPNEKADLTSSALVETEIQDLSSNTEKTSCVETTLGESVSDLEFIKTSNINVEKLPVVSDHQVKSLPKDLEHNSRNSSSNKNEIISKLKRICLSSSSGQQVLPISEDLLLQPENVEISDTEGNNKLTDSKNRDESVKIHDANESAPDSTNDGVEDASLAKSILVENNLQEETNTPDTFAATPDASEKLIQAPFQNSCVSTCSDFTENMEKNLEQEQSDICFIVNAGTISKEQYDRWSETSDEDIEFIQPYDESQKEKHELLSSSLEKLSIYSEPAPVQKPTYSKEHSSSSTPLCEADKHSSNYYQDIDDASIRSDRTATVTKNIRDPGRTMHTVHSDLPYTGVSNLGNVFSNRRISHDNLTQNTLDMEHLRFICNLKDVLRKSSTDVHAYEPPFQTMFESNRIPGCSVSTTRSRSPLLITVHCPYRNRDLRGWDNWYPSSYNSQAYYEEEQWKRPVYYSRTPKTVRTKRSSPFHFNRLRYENTQVKSNSDISVILRECVQSNHLKLSTVGLDNSRVDRISDCNLAEEDMWKTRRTNVSHSSKSLPVKNIISELCTSLHSRLHSVARQCGQKNVYFYINETSDDSFYSSTKSLLIKDGHTPTDPQEFCHNQNRESKKLLVIIRNEDISSNISKIPCLLQLKLLPNVTFAGVDIPEDLTDSTYQELFQTGGFVVSDKTVLENMTLGKLKEVLAILEKMNRTSAWKWLIHFRENRKLKEDKRTESLSHIKISLLKTQSNIIEILPYHQCDSRSKERPDDLACLLSAQSQHIHSRLAVYLTDTPSLVAEEFGHHGIIVYDVDTFVKKIQKVEAQLQDLCWS